MSEIPHIGFIVAAYAVTAVVLLGAIAAVLVDGRRQTRLLAALEHDAATRLGDRA